MACRDRLSALMSTKWLLGDFDAERETGQWQVTCYPWNWLKDVPYSDSGGSGQAAESVMSFDSKQSQTVQGSRDFQIADSKWIVSEPSGAKTELYMTMRFQKYEPEEEGPCLRFSAHKK